MEKYLEDQVLVIQASQDNLDSEITEMNSDKKKRDSNINKIKKILTQMMNEKQNYLP